MVTELVEDQQNQPCSNSSSVDMRAGAESHAGEINQDIATTAATHIAGHDDSRRQDDIDPGEPPKFAAEPVVGSRGFRKRWNEKRSSGSVPSEAGSLDSFRRLMAELPDGSGHTPSIGSASDLGQDQDELSGPILGHAESMKQTSHEFLSNVKWQTFQMPWETPVAKSVFSSEVLPTIDLKQDPSWSSATFCSPVAESPARESLSVFPKEAKPVFVSCIRSIKERTFIDMREKEMLAGLEKWNLVIRTGSHRSRVGQQIELSPDSSIEILRACMGVKSPSTVVGRANAMLSFLRWHTVNYPSEPFLPLSELHAWAGVRFFPAKIKSSSKQSVSIYPVVQVRAFCARIAGSFRCVWQW